MGSSPPKLAFGLRPFALERFFAQYEFNPDVKHLACCSDSEPLSLAELLELGNTVPGWRARWESLSLGYTESAGDPDLRDAVASRHFTSLAPENILIAAPQEAVFLAMAALLRPGDTIVCMHPAYQSLYEVASAVGAHVELWRARTAADGATWFDTKDLRATVAGREVKLVVVNAPHNPTGWLPTRDEWEDIKNCCAASTYPGGAYLFSDEMYRGLELNPADRLPTGADFMPPGHGISLGGLSKSVGLPGLRIGWIATTDRDLLAAAAGLKDYTTICPPAPSEALALAALGAWDAVIDRQLTIIRSNLQILEDYGRKWGPNVLRWQAPKAGTVGYALLALPPGTNGVDAACRLLAENHGVLLLPGTVYDDPEAEAVPGMGRVRIGFGRRNLPQALEALDAALRGLGLVNDGSE